LSWASGVALSGPPTSGCKLQSLLITCAKGWIETIPELVDDAVRMLAKGNYLSPSRKSPKGNHGEGDVQVFKQIREQRPMKDRKEGSTEVDEKSEVWRIGEAASIL
jgi:hypothetical protein